MFIPVNVNISLQSFHQPILMMCRYYCALLISYEDIRNRYTRMLSYNIIISSICVVALMLVSSGQHSPQQYGLVDVVHINALKLYLLFYIYIFWRSTPFSVNDNIQTYSPFFAPTEVAACFAVVNAHCLSSLLKVGAFECFSASLQCEIDVRITYAYKTNSATSKLGLTLLP